ncbi:peptide-methionine (S)-S-oxide reductase MsrA [Flavobacterium pallidum]|uniref:Peptide methionine sulfoxide reductase MsrA n=1 Tax=Flavobacterium pallidum TaxID=2172098 RepID=A0A2S1SJL4_9FLAO|nr:peptide-methionine (S)-S-oxide reductase MsrA [Flavobacterium pallidum]AWI26603.1 peptide-methionine (S)-S-oxide reductase [Flavobacterium pallidum]
MKKVTFLILALLGMACQSKTKENNDAMAATNEPIKMDIQDGMEVATFAGGCFWCTEAIFLELDGVKSVVSGYTGGARPNPTYEQVSSGATGHAEATQITFDPKKISFGELLEVFFATHDPTTLNRQGNDIGTQYRSEIFYHSDAQKQTAEDYIKQLTAAKTYPDPIVTKVSPAVTFYAAENYHQNYYNQNKGQSYCHYVITPKVEKVRKHFKDKLKKE